MTRTLKAMFFLGLVLALGAGCSSKTTTDENEIAIDDGSIAELPPISDAGTDAVPQESIENIAPEEAGNSLESPPPIEDLAVAAPIEQSPEVIAQTIEAAPVVDTVESSDTSSTQAPVAQSVSVGEGSYTVQSGDTLMRIAFERYGDIYKWRSIYEANRDQIRDPNQIPPGLVLRLEGGDGAALASHDGEERRVIRSGETLGTISWDIYGTQRHWKRLWENNRDLIKDPNRIFAGFYLYYTITGEEREEAERLKQGGQPRLNKTPIARRHKRNKSPQAVANDAGEDEYHVRDIQVDAPATTTKTTSTSGTLEEPPVQE